MKKIIIENRKTKFEYTILDNFTAGLLLNGNEAKAIRLGKAHLTDAYCYIEKNEVFLKGLYIPNLINITQNINQHNPERHKKLLLKKSEINKLQKNLIKGITIVVLNLHFNQKNLIKTDIALGKGKNSMDKRNALKEKDVKKQLKHLEI